MFNQHFFTDTISEHVTAKSKEGVDEPSVIIRLRSAQAYKIHSVVEVAVNWVGVEVYPDDGRPVRKHQRSTPNAGGPAFDFDRVFLPYESIELVIVTLEEKSKGVGFKRQD